jgi:uncharacterized membrane protein YeaQ/YmgE (transglycosylase-associated protein family)
MNPRPLIYIGLTIGSTIGSFIPTIWGAGYFSISSIVFSMFGAMIGMWLGYKLATF